MRICLQRVLRSEVRVAGRTVASGGRGLLLLVGVEDGDQADLRRAAEKVFQLRVFEDDDGKMNRSLADVDGDVVVVPQFTLHGDATRGRRPSWAHAARPDVAAPRIEAFAAALASLGASVELGAFREHMEVELVNDGPVTLILDL